MLFYLTIDSDGECVIWLERPERRDNGLGELEWRGRGGFIDKNVAKKFVDGRQLETNNLYELNVDTTGIIYREPGKRSRHEPAPDWPPGKEQAEQPGELEDDGASKRFSLLELD